MIRAEPLGRGGRGRVGEGGHCVLGVVGQRGERDLSSQTYNQFSFSGSSSPWGLGTGGSGAPGRGRGGRPGGAGRAGAGRGRPAWSCARPAAAGWWRGSARGCGSAPPPGSPGQRSAISRQSIFIRHNLNLVSLIKFSQCSRISNLDIFTLSF